MRELLKEAGHVSVQEAREMLVRFCNSHFKDPRDKRNCARITIPADPLRDDDIRLGAFIEQAAEAFAEVERLRAENAALAKLREWTLTFGAALKPSGADTYGEGVRACKAQVAAILRASQPANKEP